MKLVTVCSTWISYTRIEVPDDVAEMTPAHWPDEYLEQIIPTDASWATWDVIEVAENDD
jgi:hypothetical protein